MLLFENVVPYKLGKYNPALPRAITERVGRGLRIRLTFGQFLRYAQMVSNT